jgi:two-component system KDP operon response regulator KdpE
MTQSAAEILVIEDEQAIRKFLRVSLESVGYAVREADTAAKGLGEAKVQPPDALVLDLGLPDADGLTVIEKIRQWSSVPIIVLSARGRESDKITALDAGADDYLTKPFAVGELLARVRASLRRANTNDADAGRQPFEAGELKVDLSRRQILLAGKEVHLTPTEFRLLSVLVKNAGKVVTHRQLLKDVWGPESANDNHYLRVYLGQLRRKIEADPARPRLLKTEPGIGYRLVDE